MPDPNLYVELYLSAKLQKNRRGVRTGELHCFMQIAYRDLLAGGSDKVENGRWHHCDFDF